MVLKFRGKVQEKLNKMVHVRKLWTTEWIIETHKVAWEGGTWQEMGRT